MYFCRLSGSNHKGIQAKVGCTKTQDSWTLRYQNLYGTVAHWLSVVTVLCIKSCFNHIYVQ